MLDPGTFMNRTTAVAVFGILFIACSGATRALAQIAPPATTPPSAGQTPLVAPAGAKAPSLPFPDGAKIAFVDFQFIARESAIGRAGNKAMQALTNKKTAELEIMNKQLQSLQEKQAPGGAPMSDVDRGQNAREIDKLTTAIAVASKDAQQEVDEKSIELMKDFMARVTPSITAFAKEKGLDAVFMQDSTQNSPAAFVKPGLDISAEIVARLDAKK